MTLHEQLEHLREGRLVSDATTAHVRTTALRETSDEDLVAEILRRALVPGRPVVPGPADRICAALRLEAGAPPALIAERVEELALLASGLERSLAEAVEVCGRRLTALREIEVALDALASRSRALRRQS